MAKINPNLLETPGVHVEKIQAKVSGQGDFLVYLRQPDFSELLKIQGETQRLTVEWERRGDCYPSSPTVIPSPELWNVVVPVLHLQCDEKGEELPPEDRYSEAELMPIFGKVPPAYVAAAAAITIITNAVQGDLGNDSEAGGG